MEIETFCLHVAGGQCVKKVDDRSLKIHFLVLCMMKDICLGLDIFDGYKFFKASLRLYPSKQNGRF